MKISAGILVCMVTIATVGATSWKTLQSAAPHASGATLVSGPSPEHIDLSDLPRALELPLVKTPLQPGDLAPDFNLPDQSGHRHRLSDLRGQTVVLAFYPRDFTLICSTEAIAFNRYLPAFQVRGAKVFSVSVQNWASKSLFAGRYNISYPLLADSDKSTARDYRVLSKDGVAGRVTFVIGTDGHIQWTDQNVQVATHARDVIHFLDSRAPITNFASNLRTKEIVLTPPVTAPRFAGNILGLTF